MWCIPEPPTLFPAVQTHRRPPEPCLPPVPNNKRLIGVFTHDAGVPEPAPLAGPSARRKTEAADVSAGDF